MIGDLFINGKDAYKEYGVEMGDDFLSSLRASAPMKEHIENSSRLQHGIRVIDPIPRLDKRDLTLAFTISGIDKTDFERKKDAFENVMQQRNVVISVPKRTTKKYKLFYTGNSLTYSENIDGTFCKWAAKFIEPNPTDRA